MILRGFTLAYHIGFHLLPKGERFSALALTNQTVNWTAKDSTGFVILSVKPQSSLWSNFDAGVLANGERLEESIRECEERAALAAASDPYRYIEKRKPIPDPQETGLVYGNKNGAKKPE
ncbi:UNVERIFIED_CONTAM: hypothetical protein Sangu_2228100 [Sesamum angustifolium]|uniref:Uncharacterized protein n=1 Tax=Sesamum angustifolium TaxID=2727405 RepID=A0AAW2L5V4_9LAMI